MTQRDFYWEYKFRFLDLRIRCETLRIRSKNSSRGYLCSSTIFLYLNFKSQRIVSNPSGFGLQYGLMFPHMRDNLGKNLLFIIQNVRDTFLLIPFDMIRKEF